MTLTAFPVSVVLADTSILLLANTVLLVVKPLALVLDLLLLGALGRVGVSALSLAFLRAINKASQFQQLQTDIWGWRQSPSLNSKSLTPFTNAPS